MICPLTSGSVYRNPKPYLSAKSQMESNFVRMKAQA